MGRLKMKKLGISIRILPTNEKEILDTEFKYLLLNIFTWSFMGAIYSRLGLI